MAIQRTSLAMQTSCPKCMRVNEGGAARCVGCGAFLPVKLHALNTFNTAPNLNDSRPEDEGAGSIEPADVDPKIASELGLSTDMPLTDSKLELGEWLTETPHEIIESQSLSTSPLSLKLLAEKQDAGIARSCYERTAVTLVANEAIEYIATVSLQEAGDNPVCAVATNKRIIIFSKLGDDEIDLEHPQICFWQDLDDITFEEEPEIMLRLTAVNGWQVELKDIFPPQARRLYIYGVDHSERVLLNRVAQHMATHSSSPYISETLDESQLESEPMKESSNITTAPSAANTSISQFAAQPAHHDAVPVPVSAPPAQSQPTPQPLPLPMPVEPQGLDTRPVSNVVPLPPLPQPASQPVAPPRPGMGSVLANVMRSVQASENATGMLGPLSGSLSSPLSNPLSNPNLSGPTSSPLHSDQLSGRLPADPYASSFLPNQPPNYENPTGRLNYAFDGTTDPIYRHAYDPAAMSGPLQPQPQPMAQGMPYIHPAPAQQPYPAQGAYPPQPDPQHPQYGQDPQYPQNGQPQYGYAPAPAPTPNSYQYPQAPYGQPPYGNQSAPYGQGQGQGQGQAQAQAQVPPAYPQQPQPYVQPQAPAPQAQIPQQPAYYAPQPAPALPASAAPQPDPPADEPEEFVLRLQKLKQMLDADLITLQDYQTKKAQILSEM